MDKRKEKILKLIVEKYIETAEPVGSNFLAQNSKLSVSGATLRNEMRDMENEGYLSHPHTSAGRMPTENGYKYYVEHLMNKSLLDKSLLAKFSKIIGHSDNMEPVYKQVAKIVSEMANALILISFNKKNYYYTGFCNRCSQPEFSDKEKVVNFSAIFDETEKQIDHIYKKTGKHEVNIFIGKDSPFGAFSSTLSVNIEKDSLLAMVGPMRMDYQQNYSILNLLSGLNRNV